MSADPITRALRPISAASTSPPTSNLMKIVPLRTRINDEMFGRRTSGGSSWWRMA